MGNIGDSRCIACCSGLAEALSIDHKPGDSLERDRIENVSTYIDYIRDNCDLLPENSLSDLAV